jgi:hypothetical protein
MNTVDKELRRILKHIGLTPGVCAACDRVEVSDAHTCWPIMNRFVGETVDKLFHSEDRRKGGKAVIRAIVSHHLPIAHMLCRQVPK